MKEINPGTIQGILDPQQFAWDTGVTLRGFSVTAVSEGWQIIFRGTKRDGSAVYCLFVAVEIPEALQGLYSSICNKYGARLWYPDKYAK